MQVYLLTLSIDKTFLHIIRSNFAMSSRQYHHKQNLAYGKIYGAKMRCANNLKHRGTEVQSF